MSLEFAPSPIHGHGLFVVHKLPRNTLITKAITKNFGIPHVTPEASKINHSWFPNCKLTYYQDEYYIETLYDMSPYTEITINYNDTPWYISKPDPSWK